MLTLYTLMSTTNVYKENKTDKTYETVRNGFIKTLVHILILVIAILAMAIYYSQIEETVRESYQIDRSTEDFISYSKYKSLYHEYTVNQDAIITCDCTYNQILWASFTDEIYIVDDDVCSTAFAAYNPCYFDPICRDGKVGQVLYTQLAELCGTAQYLRPLPSDKPKGSLSSSRVIALDYFDGLAIEEALLWLNQIQISFTTSYEMNYRLINDDTDFFYKWAGSTTLEDVTNATYWMEDFNLSTNTSYKMAEAWFDVDFDAEGYVVIADSINSAFLSDLQIIYRYAQNGSNDKVGYYEKCAPYQCIWFISRKKTVMEIVVTIFGLIGGVHASLFVLINLMHSMYSKCKGENEETKEEYNKVELVKHQEANAATTKASTEAGDEQS